ncbi:YdcF family protein [Shumkonia mesophila]|uniref:YdcF family protein n=1 Tax=Shumkonia mesophila TaxID=2838854 RepID=UPI002934A678|nr:YdcF family protein [Shumkonia mesophila]
MFFSLSKILWWFAAPANVLFLLLAAGVLLLWTRWRRLGRGLATLAVLLFMTITALPLGSWMIQQLEDRFPMVSPLPPKVDGIVVLGGAVNPWMTVERGQVALGDHADRLTEFAALARRYPEARLIFSGGTGSLTRQDIKEADIIAPLWEQIGLDGRRIVYENQSRNTYENAVLSFPLARPRPGETWIMVTSAFHMPRAVGCFRKAGWTILPYPVDYKTGRSFLSDFSLNPASRLMSLNAAAHEWLGLVFYRLTGKTDSLFPGPASS